MYEYRAKVVHVVDADTIDVDIDLGFYIHNLRMRLRFAGIDAWEVRGPERPKGLIAKKAMTDLLLAHGNSIIVRTAKDPRRDVDAFDSFRRFIADVYVYTGEDETEPDTVTEDDHIHVNRWLVEGGHAIWKDY